MAFNETLTPQDSFTETNVTRKRSVVGNSHFYQESNYSVFLIHQTYFIKN